MSDWTNDEFGKVSGRLHKKERLEGKGPLVKSGIKVLSEKDLPNSVDWRRSKAVTSATRQLDCGGCWAFTAAAAIETANSIAGGATMRLSVQ